MAKTCPNSKCNKENPSSANFCMFCGTAFVSGEELPIEDKLQKKLLDAEKEIERLNKSLDLAHKHLDEGPAINRNLNKRDKQYYIEFDEEQYGPYELEEVRDLGLLADTFVCVPNESEEWKQAICFPELADFILYP